MNAPTVFRTTACAQHAHPEFTLRFAARAPVSGLERMLISYLEGAVARGSRFTSGQTVQFGWSTLRIVERPDGTLGLEERTEPDSWSESVDRTLLQTWSQKEIAASLDLDDRLDFPRQDQVAMVSACTADATAWLLTRLPANDVRFSGWSIACAENHDHGERVLPPLLAVAARMPFVTQFLALPTGSAVLVTGPGRIRANVLVDGHAIEPRLGSYLAALNSDAGR